MVTDKELLRSISSEVLERQAPMRDYAAKLIAFYDYPADVADTLAAAWWYPSHAKPANGC